MNEENKIKEIVDKINKQNSARNKKNRVKSSHNNKYSLEIKEISLIEKTDKNKNTILPHKTRESLSESKTFDMKTPHQSAKIQRSFIERKKKQKSISPLKNCSKFLNFKSPSPKKSHFKSLSGLSIYKNLKLREDKNKFTKYNTQELSYLISSEYSKIECNEKNFIDRMRFYSEKYNLKNEKINQIVNDSKPQLPEEVRIEAFNRLINDSNRRVKAKKRIEAHLKQIKMNHSNTTSSSPVSREQWNKYYKKRFSTNNGYAELMKKKLLESKTKSTSNLDKGFTISQADLLNSNIKQKVFTPAASSTNIIIDSNSPSGDRKKSYFKSKVPANTIENKTLNSFRKNKHKKKDLMDDFSKKVKRIMSNSNNKVSINK